MFVRKLWMVCTAMVFLVGCSHEVHPVSVGFHIQIPEKDTRVVAWGNHESAVGAAVSWLQRKHLRPVERARIHEIFKEQQVQLTNSSEDEGSILQVGEILGADWVVFVDTAVRTNERTAMNKYNAAFRNEYHLSVDVRGVNVETSEILWSGSAQYLKGVNNPELGIIYLTQTALEHAWCPDGKWTEGSCQKEASQTN